MCIPHLWYSLLLPSFLEIWAVPRGTHAAWGGLLQPAPADGALCACRLLILRELAQGMVPELWLAPGLGLMLKRPVSSHLAMPRAQPARGPPPSCCCAVSFRCCCCCCFCWCCASLGLEPGTARVGWNGALLVQWWVVVARRLWPVDEHYGPVPPRLRQCSQAVASLLRRQEPGCPLLAQLLWMWTNGEG